MEPARRDAWWSCMTAKNQPGGQLTEAGLAVLIERARRRLAAPLAGRELEYVTATEVLGEVGRDHRVEGLIVTDREGIVEPVSEGRFPWRPV